LLGENIDHSSGRVKGNELRCSILFVHFRDYIG